MMKRRILYVQYTNPAAYPSLEHSSGILANLHWEILFLGTGAFSANELQFRDHPRITVHLLNFCPAGWRQKLHYLWFCLWVIGWTIHWRPQWIYASDVLICPLGLLLSYFPGIKIIYHEHDSPSGPMESQRMHFCLTCRKKLALRSAQCVLPNQLRVENFQKEVGGNGNIVSVWNCPTTNEVAQQRLNSKSQKLAVLYHGSIVPARLPVTVLNALALLQANVSLTVIGYVTIGHAEYIDQLKKIASDLGIGQKIHFKNTFPIRSELLRFGKNFDVGVALMPKNSNDLNERTMATASNKPFDYLAGGLALLVSNLPEWKKMYVEPGYGLTCNPEDPQSIATALHWYLEHPEERRVMGERGRQRILNDWNYEFQFRPVLGLLNANYK